jgi:hypothetical protein
MLVWCLSCILRAGGVFWFDGSFGFPKARGEDRPLETIRFISAKRRLQGVGVGILLRCLKAVVGN